MLVELPPVNPDEIVEYNSEQVPIKDLPRDLRAMMGMGHDPADMKGREQHEGPWPYKPDACLVAANTRGKWINDDQNLVCPGCGLDFT
ncbi:hypothetical protein [Streptomyces sp. 5-10]|uniref:hypothetical protein n=1 Tax=Streptomyces sp. 5-10 TaxID=878925 RepID=UPI00168B9979|nr:hypothetical protein [Streptomyces sp. 5-10]MBD3004742.1 hypothetical protein [Streptomyces sp. 5-10]